MESTAAVQHLMPNPLNLNVEASMSGVHQQTQLSRPELPHVCAIRLVSGRCFSALAPYIFQSHTREGPEIWKFLPVSDVQAGPRATNCDCCSGCRYDFLSILSINASGSDACGMCCRQTLVHHFWLSGQHHCQQTQMRCVCCQA